MDSGIENSSREAEGWGTGRGQDKGTAKRCEIWRSIGEESDEGVEGNG